MAFADRPSLTNEGVLEISRFSCILFHGVRGFLDSAGPDSHSRITRLRVAFPLLRMESASCSSAFSKLNRPAHRCLRTTLQETPRDDPCKTRGQDGFATSFPVGLLHPLQHAGLSRRSPVCRSLARNNTESSKKAHESRLYVTYPK